MDPPVAAFAAHVLTAASSVTTPSAATGDALARSGIPHRVLPVGEVAADEAAAIALVDDELSHAGAHAEGLIADAARALRPGGLLAVAARGTCHAHATSTSAGLRTFTADELARLLGHAGFDVSGRWAPGAASELGAGSDGTFDPVTDRVPGLLDAAARVAATAIRYADEAARSRAFFHSLPLKVIAAGVVCRDARDRLLLVYDSFKQHWTVPGGVVDADEDPQTGAARETREEAGIEVDVGPLLGLFALRWPDRLLLLYGARPVGQAAPRPLHAHEIEAADWVPLEAALERLNPRTARQVRRCVDTPGGTWRD